MLGWGLFFLGYVLLSLYALQALKTIFKSPVVLYVWIVVSLFVVGNFFYQFAIAGIEGGMTRMKSLAATWLLILVLCQLVVIGFLLAEDMVRLGVGVFRKLSGADGSPYIPSRRKFVSALALGVAAIPFAGLIYGMYRGKYDFRVLKYTLEFDDLPEGFEGYRIAQISDLHLGSFDNREKVAYAIDLINVQDSDVLVFTGDMVNNKAEEMLPWMDILAKLTARDGKYAILGNHDYGDYIRWNSDGEKAKNLEHLKSLQRQLGFDLLLNESRQIERNGDCITLIGVENWGAGGFQKEGDLDKAVRGIDKDAFKILMSHDPSHWEQQVISHPLHFHLTLSGHTHGMQFGVEIPGFVKWSPVQWRYKYWAGIYKEMGQYINVNRGLGYIGYPGRVGIWPEISVIELRGKSSDV